MAINRDTVLHVARLARLSLEQAEVDPLLADLGRIVGYIDQLAELDTTNIAPTAHIAVRAAPRRSDETRESLDTQVALAQGPRVHDSGFAVPAFVDEG